MNGGIKLNKEATAQREVYDKVKDIYFKILSQGYVPKSEDVKYLVIEEFKIECFDLIHEDSILEITDTTINDILSEYKDVHYHDGKRLYECQNFLFNNWYTFQRLIMIAD